MTLEPLPGAFRPGGPSTPQPTFADSFGPEPYQLQFLSAEERATTNLMSFFQQARLELETFIREGDLSVSDSTFYRQLLDETNRIGTQLNAEASKWVTSVIPDAYSAGWRAWSSVVVPREALAALSRDTLGLITDTTNGIRQSVRGAIAQGILQGLSGSDVRARILATGLTNIPHWPNVEYRAGVIARTETMRAFNGGVLAGMEGAGALFARWITSPDEAVCPICSPRSGVVYRLSGADGFPGDDPYPNARSLPRLPAHPRCRCSIRAEFRDADGKVLKANAPPVEPELPSDAMGGSEAPVLPSAAGDFERALARLQTYGSANAETWAFTNKMLKLARPGMTEDELNGFLNILRAGNGKLALDMAAFRSLEAKVEATFWRNLGQLSDDEVRLLANMRGAAGNEGFRSFLQLRYGVEWGKPVGWSPALRYATVTALERLRAVAPRYVVDSDYLKFLGMRPPTASRFGSNVIARAFPSGHVEGNMGSWETFTSRALRSGQPTGAEEVILHEFMHTVHFRYGLYDRTVNPSTRYDAYRTAEAIGTDWHTEYQAIRRSTTQIVAPDSLEALRTKAAEYRKQGEDLLAIFQADATKSYGYSAGSSWIRRAEEIEKSIAKIEAGGAELWPTEYARTEYAEDFAEAGMLYFLNPARLKQYCPARYAFFRDRVFGGWEP